MQYLREALRRQVLHHQHRLAVVGDHVENRDGVAMLQPGGDPCLPEGASSRVLGLGFTECGRQQEFFHRNGSAKNLVARDIDDAHRAATDPALQAIAAGDQASFLGSVPIHPVKATWGRVRPPRQTRLGCGATPGRSCRYRQVSRTGGESRGVVRPHASHWEITRTRQCWWTRCGKKRMLAVHGLLAECP